MVISAAAALLVELQLVAGKTASGRSRGGELWLRAHKRPKRASRDPSFLPSALMGGQCQAAVSHCMAKARERESNPQMMLLPRLNDLESLKLFQRSIQNEFIFQ